MVKIFSNLDDSGIHKRCLALPLLRSKAWREGYRSPAPRKSQQFTHWSCCLCLWLFTCLQERALHHNFPWDGGWQSTIAVRHTQPFLLLPQKDTKSAPNRPLESPTSQQGKSLDYCATKAMFVCYLCLWPKPAWKFKGRLAP